MEHIKVAKVDKVFLKLSAKHYGTETSIHLTAHHLIFVHPDTSEHWVPYATVAALIRPSTTGSPKDHNLDIITRHFCFYRLTIPLAVLDSVYHSLVKLVHIESIDQLYAFSYIHTHEITQNVGWAWFSMHDEYVRQGVSSSLNPYWRITTVNHDFSMCKSYPNTLAVPTDILDTTLRHAAKHRSRGRIPVLTYLHPSGASLSRCAQPFVGVKANRSPQDERLFQSIFAQPILNRSQNTDHLIVDARPPINAAANHVKGSGSEIMDHYRGARKEYVPIDNIHVMRDSISKLLAVMQQSVLEGTPLTVTDLDKSNWLYHIQLLLDGTQLIVDTMVKDHAHVVVHCSDGWDRTSQLCALTQVCMDPYFRTINGFAVLVEKDWLAFGHKFSDRSGHLTPKAGDHALAQGLMQSFWAKMENSVEQREIAPIFHQFLDALHQLLLAYPKAFQFNEQMLVDLHLHVYSCQFGSFLFNSHHDRLANNVPSRTHSVWSLVHQNRALYTNPHFDEHTLPLSCRLPKLRYWLRVLCTSTSLPADASLFTVDPPATCFSSAVPVDSSDTSLNAESVSIASSVATASVALGSAAVGSVRGFWSRMGAPPSPANLLSTPSTMIDPPLPNSAAESTNTLRPQVYVAESAIDANEFIKPADASLDFSPLTSNDPLGHTDLESISLVATTRGAVRSAGSVS